MIAVVDYGMGNLASVNNALLSLGADAAVSSKAGDIEAADKLVLPGVGAFPDAMKELEKRSLIEPILRAINKGRMFLGICLGLQLLFSYSEEGGHVKGFDILKGKVVRFPAEKGLKVPQIGWNRVRGKGALLKGIKDGSYFYFDHSYYAAPDDKDVVAATTDYGVSFASFVSKGNIHAVQFHPEKSQAVGLKFLENFIKC